MGVFKELLENSELIIVPRSDYAEMVSEFLIMQYDKKLVSDGEYYYSVDTGTPSDISITKKTVKFLDNVRNFKKVNFKTEQLFAQMERYSANTYNTNLVKGGGGGNYYYTTRVDINKKYDVLFSRARRNAYCATQDVYDDLVEFSKKVTTNKKLVRDSGYSQIRSAFGDSVKVKKAAAEGEYYITSNSTGVRIQVFVRNGNRIYIGKVQVDSMVDDKIVSAIKLLV